MAYTIETLPSGSKRIRINYTDEFGNHKRKSVTGKTERDVLRKAFEVEENLKRRTSPEKATIYDVLFSYIELKQYTLSPSTISKYKSLLSNSFNSIKDVPAERISDRIAQKWINEMVERGLSPKTVKNSFSLLCSALKQYKIPLPVVSLPQAKPYLHEYPQDYEVAQLVDATRGTSLELPILLAAYGGMRMSEILGLKWDDIGSSHISIQRAKVYVKGEYVEKATKSVSGTRMLPLFAPIKDALSRTERKGEFVVPFTARSITRRYNTVLKHLGLRQYRFHDLRHHAASVGMKLGIPDDYMRQYIGHSTVNMLKRYQHQMESATSRYAHMLDKYYADMDTNSDTIPENR